MKNMAAHYGTIMLHSNSSFFTPHSSFLQVFRYILFDTFGDIACIFFDELFTGDVFVQLDVAFADGSYDFVCHFRNLLSFFALEAVIHQPFAYEFL